ncbi:MAG: hypothetical protein RR767_07160, partial [Acinetobacter sp.]
MEQLEYWQAIEDGEMSEDDEPKKKKKRKRTSKDEEANKVAKATPVETQTLKSLDKKKTR